ncbi:hypothetical protein [Moorena sp. SIOASIH]|nr:hypothetical protein [Moorena sp. SIOASIH]
MLISDNIKIFITVTCSLFPVTCSLFPAPYSLLPTPYSLCYI